MKPHNILKHNWLKLFPSRTLKSIAGGVTFGQWLNLVIFLKILEILQIFVVGVGSLFEKFAT